ncbi:putative MATE family efflux protein [Lacrimispora xylanisolvens]|uniref:Putative MATE family efflux protein n=1 Tax=Lacrimispora xylanisolvens TaxID=384636 RepID=A0A2S6HXJ2_9FIRM|nr:MATE family efflux transporter [Hungatella xylanolytica]PPK82732.1 putative MATE family efflux protein [Hungatella xylanolytica]
MEKNLTKGSVFKTVVYFSLPYLLSYFLQTLYGMADLFIVGQFNGVDSITAVSIASQVMHMITVMIVGLAMGATVMIGRAVGAGKHEEVSTVIGNTIALFMVLSVIIMIVLLMVVKPIAAVMLTPPEAFGETVTYLTICMIGIPFITGYNIISSIFRGMGDSKSPMYFIGIACAANIVLDYLFIGVFKLGAAGAALGTTLSQSISVIISLTFIRKQKMGISLSRKDLKPKTEVILNLLKVGIPVALQDGFIQISFLIITIIANNRGLNDAAAVGIVEKIIGILFLVPSSMLSTVSVLSAQNAGAGKHDRARQTLWIGILITVVFGTISAVVMQFTAGSVIGLFTDNTKVILLGGQYMSSYVWDCIFAGIHFCFSGYFCAYGLSGISFIHNSISIICARIPLAYLASIYFADTLFPMGIAAPVGSILSVVICISVFIWLSKRPGKLNGSI